MQITISTDAQAEATTSILVYETVNMPTGLPVIDLDVFITGSHNSEAVIQECKKVCYSKIK
jgi:hypothetical protein